MFLLLPILLSASSIIYELGFAYSLSILYPNTYLYYIIVIGLYIFSLGIGTTLYTYLKKDNLINFYIYVELGIILTVPLFLYILFTYHNIYILYFLIVFTGTLTGMEIPLLTDIINTKFTKILSLDYLGSLLGSLAFGLLLLPNIGIINTLLYVSLINLSTFFIFSSKRSIIIGIIGFVFISGLLYNNTLEHLWQNRWKNIITKKELCKQRKCKVKINSIETTNYQTIVDVNITYNLKKKFNINCLYIDKEVQYCSNWSDTYHTYLGYIPIKNWININKRKPYVLILGGGDAFLYKKIKKYTNSIKVIDIDKKLTKRYFSINNKNLINEDAVNYLMNDNKKYDMIFWDLPMPTNKKLLRLYSIETFQLIYSSLTKNGWFVHYIPLNKSGEKIFIPFINLLQKSKFKYSYLYEATEFSDKDKIINKNTPFKYEEFFMITTKKKIKLDFLTKEINLQQKNINIKINSIIFPNKNYILKY